MDERELEDAGLPAIHNDSEINDIYDDFSFKMRTIDNRLAADNMYYNTANAGEERTGPGEAPFVNKLPAKEFTTERMQRIIQEEQAELERLRREGDEGQLALFNERQLLDLAAGEEWRPDLPQPADKCFLCRLLFDSKVKMPLVLPCGHTVCRECVIERESQHLEVECFYDNCVVKGVAELEKDTTTLKRLVAQDKLAFEKQVREKVKMAETHIENPAAPITRQDLAAEGGARNDYRENPVNKDYHRISRKAVERRQREEGVVLDQQPQTLDEMFEAELLEDVPEGQEATGGDKAGAIASLQEIERQRKLEREKERQHELARKGLEGRSLQVHLEPVGQLDGRQLLTTNQTLSQLDVLEQYERDHLSNANQEAMIAARKQMQELFKRKSEAGKFEEFTRALENSQKLSQEEINQLKKIAREQWYGASTLPGRQDQEPPAEPGHGDESKKLEELYDLPPSRKQIVPGSQQEQQMRDERLSQVNDIDAKQKLYERLNILQATTTNDMGGVLDYHTDFEKMREAQAAEMAAMEGGGTQEANRKPSQYSQAKYHPESPFTIYGTSEQTGPPQSVHDRRRPPQLGEADQENGMPGEAAPVDKYELPVDEEPPEDEILNSSVAAIQPADAQQQEEQPVSSDLKFEPAPLEVGRSALDVQSEPPPQPEVAAQNEDLGIDNYQRRATDTSTASMKRKKKKKRKRVGKGDSSMRSVASGGRRGPLQKIEEDQIAEEQASEVMEPEEVPASPLYVGEGAQAAQAVLPAGVREETLAKPRSQLERNDAEVQKYVPLEAEAFDGGDFTVQVGAPEWREQPKTVDEEIERNLANYQALLEERKRGAQLRALKDQIDHASIQKLRTCVLHPEEPIKYYCKDDKEGLCAECIVHHARHDFIFADEDASKEVKEHLETLFRAVGRHHEGYGDLHRKVEQHLVDLEKYKNEELNKVTEAFRQVRAALDQREAQFKREYQQRVKDQFSFMTTEAHKLRHIYSEIDGVYQGINKLQVLLERCDDYTVVGACQKIRLVEQSFKVLQRKLIEPSPLDSFRVASGEGGLQTMPIFEVNASAALKFIETLGHIGNKYDYERINQISHEAQNQRLRSVETRQARLLGAQTATQVSALGGSSSLIDGKIKMANGSDPASLGPQIATITRCQQLQLLYQTTPHSEHIYWPRWDTQKMYRYDFFNKRWAHQEQLPLYQQGFLFFSSIAHLPKGLGMFILGGSDIEDNFSRRSTLFSKYSKYLEKPPMIDRRAFFPSIFCISDSCLYVFGGHDGAADLAVCERYSVQENVWRSIQPMRARRNGASVVAFDRVLFVFGGNNAQGGSLDTIERYAVEFDKWSMPRVRLKEPLHDTIAFNLGGARVLIFGGTAKDRPNTRFDVYDLTSECLGAEETQMNVGKMYLPPVYDPVQGVMHAFLGYGDNEPQHQQMKIQSLMCTCRSVAFTDKATSSDDLGGELDELRKRAVATPSDHMSVAAFSAQKPPVGAQQKLPDKLPALLPATPSQQSLSKMKLPGAKDPTVAERGSVDGAQEGGLGARIQSRRLEEQRPGQRGPEAGEQRPRYQPLDQFSLVKQPSSSGAESPSMAQQRKPRRQIAQYQMMAGQAGPQDAQGP